MTYDAKVVLMKRLCALTRVTVKASWLSFITIAHQRSLQKTVQTKFTQPNNLNAFNFERN